MRIAIFLLVSLLLTACSQEFIEEFAFRKSLELDLLELCGEDDEECREAVKSQIKPCMEKSEWRKFLKDSENEEELNRFVKEFYACIVDPDGNPYFAKES